MARPFRAAVRERVLRDVGRCVKNQAIIDRAKMEKVTEQAKSLAEAFRKTTTVATKSVQDFRGMTMSGVVMDEVMDREPPRPGEIRVGKDGMRAALQECSRRAAEPAHATLRRTRRERREFVDR